LYVPRRQLIEVIKQKENKNKNKKLGLEVNAIIFKFTKNN